MILTSTLLCDRKKSSAMVAVPRLLELTHPDVCIYLNIETENLEENFGDLMALLEKSGRPYHYDVWHSRSSWSQKPRFDQDQARLHPIMIGRNMSIQAAQGIGATHLLQVDADVVVPRDSIERLLTMNRPLVGGMVRGRGAHSGITYGKAATYDLTPGLPAHWREMEYCTCGFVLIARELFDLLKYRSGPHNRVKSSMLSEDPAFGTDAHDVWKMPWWTVDTTLWAEHWDDPEKPLRHDEVAQF